MVVDAVGLGWLVGGGDGFRDRVGVGGDGFGLVAEGEGGVVGGDRGDDEGVVGEVDVPDPVSDLDVAFVDAA